MVRHKNRYMIVHINFQDNTLSLNPTSLQNSIWQKVEQLHGDFGVATIRAGFRIAYCEKKTGTAVIKSRHGPHKLIGSALPCINSIGKKLIYVNTLYTGATIRQCYKFLVNHLNKEIDEVHTALKSLSERSVLEEVLTNLDSIMDLE